MKKTIAIINTLIAILLSLLNYTGYSQALQWAVGMGSGGIDQGNNLTVDNNGFVVSIGYFSGTVDFDPGAGIYNLSSAANTDSYIQKLDSAGNFVWAKSIGNANASGANRDIKTDIAGNIYIVGHFTNTLDFDPGPATYNLTSAGQDDIFILKLNAAGNFIWAKRMGGFEDDLGYLIEIDANNNVYTSGGFKDVVDFDPGAGNFMLTAFANRDIFISKLDSGGNFIWAKSIGDFDNDYVVDLHIDHSGNVLTTGSYSGTVDFDPGAGVFNLTGAGGYHDVFILKLNVAGNFLWAGNMGSVWHDQGTSITTDTGNNVYVTGQFQTVADFDPGAGVYNLTSNGDLDIFISKLDSNGIFVWAKGIGGSGFDSGHQVVTDNAGNVYLSAHFETAADVDPGPGVYGMASPNLNCWFVSKSDMNGNFLWAKAFDFNSINYTNYIALHGNSLYRTGLFENTTDMDPDASVYNLTSNGTQDIYVQKYDYCGTTYNINYDACDSLMLFGITYTGNFDTVLQYVDVNGCDSIQYIHIHIHPSFHTNLTQTVCDSFTLNAQTYTSSGTYIQNFISAFGCDSVITLNLTVNYSDSDTILQQAYGSYTLNGQTYFASGIYNQLFTGMAGCDSLIILNLNIESNNPCTPDIIINSSPYVNYLTESQTWIMTSGTVLIPLGTYAKLDANANSYITLNPGFKADFGSVFVAQAFNGCTAGAPQLPNAKIFNGESFKPKDEIILYPNPTNGMIHIQHVTQLENIMVFDMVGKLLINQKCNGETETNIDLSNLPNGVYHVKAAGYNSIKVVKNN